MHCSFSATVLATFSMISIASAGPILVSREVCGAAPSGTVAQTPLLQPTGITTAAQCAAQCQGNPACLSFLFGLVDGVDKCMLYSVPASSLPPSSNLVAYDIGCSSIPSVVPTLSNPGGLKSRHASGAQGAEGASQVGSHAAPVNAAPAGSPNPIATPSVDDLGACLAACKGNPSCIAYTFESGVCKLFGPTVSRRQQQSGAEGASSGAKTGSTGSSSTGSTSSQVGTHAAPVNAAPAGNPNPIATPSVDDLSACLAACKGNPSCIAYTFESGVCKLFGPTVGRRQQQSGAQGASGGAQTGAGATGSTGSTSSTAGTHAAPMNSVPAGSPAPIATPKVDDLSACLAACRGNPACVAYTFESGICKLFN